MDRTDLTADVVTGRGPDGDLNAITIAVSVQSTSSMSSDIISVDGTSTEGGGTTISINLTADSNVAGDVLTGGRGIGLPVGGTTGQVAAKASNDDYDYEWTSLGAGDMHTATYDPTNVADDAFDQDNMVDGTTNKNYTATEETKLSGIEELADVTDTTNVTAAGALMDSELGTGVETFLGTPSSANLATALTDETGSGAAVFGTSPTIVTPTIASMTNAQHDHADAAGGGDLDIPNIFDNVPFGQMTYSTHGASGGQVVAVTTDQILLFPELETNGSSAITKVSSGVMETSEAGWYQLVLNLAKIDVNSDVLAKFMYSTDSGSSYNDVTEWSRQLTMLINRAVSLTAIIHLDSGDYVKSHCYTYVQARFGADSAAQKTEASFTMVRVA